MQTFHHGVTAHAEYKHWLKALCGTFDLRLQAHNKATLVCSFWTQSPGSKLPESIGIMGALSSIHANCFHALVQKPA